MDKAYKMIYEGGVDEIVEKKSRFIAATAPVDSEEEAQSFIEKIKKEHWSARHNCYAYVIGDRHQLQRFSDDGEPSQTAGKPMLDVLLGEDVHNCVVVVTRYFGGVLLGTGGLVRAYTKAAACGLAASKIAERRPGFAWTLRTDYNGIGKITYLLGQKKIPILSSEYTHEVSVQVVVPLEEAQGLKKALTEATNGKVVFEKEERVSYAVIDGAVHLYG